MEVYVYEIVLATTPWSSDSDSDFVKVSGLLTSVSYGDAAEKLENYYESSLHRIINLKCANFPLIELPKEIVRNYDMGVYNTNNQLEIKCDQYGVALPVSPEAKAEAEIDWSVTSPEASI